MTDNATTSSATTRGVSNERTGLPLVFLSALFWSFGGAIARFVENADGWTMLFWRSSWAAVFLLCFLWWRDGARGSLRLFRDMGIPGVVVGICFGVASSCFVIALGYTTVANIILINASVPLIAALIAWIVFREHISLTTWLAIAAVIVGVGVMVSDTLGESASVIGNILALTNAIAFAIATVITRRYADVRMTPATCLGTILASLFAATQVATLAVTLTDMGLLFAFGALNLGLGLALFGLLPAFRTRS